LEPTVIGSTKIDTGTVVLLLLGAANRDPSRFDRPADFDIERADTQSVSFGAGAHYCLGAPLARLEARVLFPRLLQRFSGLRADGPAAWRPGLTFRGLSSLPVSTY
jgi:cytochrome P450